MGLDPPAVTHRIRPELPIDLPLTLNPLRLGRNDPSTQRAEDGAFWLARRTPSGPATMRISADGEEIVGEAWGPGAAAMVESLADRVGANDSLEGFAPKPPIAALAEKYPGLRIAKSGDVFLASIRAVAEQKVTGLEAKRAYTGMHRRFSESAPGPRPMLLPPDPEVLRKQPYYAFHEIYLERRRAELIRLLASRAVRLDQLASLPIVDARRELLSIRGIGPWSVAEIGRSALGDADGLSVGDYHLKNHVVYFFLGQPRGTDEQMLELLKGYAGHRGRVQRLIETGAPGAPRYGPRRTVRRID